MWGGFDLDLADSGRYVGHERTGGGAHVLSGNTKEQIFFSLYFCIVYSYFITDLNYFILFYTKSKYLSAIMFSQLEDC